MLSPGIQLRMSADPTASAVRGGVMSASCLGRRGMEMPWAVTAQPPCTR